MIRFACLLQCLAIDAAENRVAAGDVTGRIIIWHGLRTALADVEAGREPRALYCTSLHWHSQAVACLSFSLDSIYLLSGGGEAVLVGLLAHARCRVCEVPGLRLRLAAGQVAWLMGSNAKRFLPRLSGQLSGISALPDAARYLITQTDNTVRVVNLASMKVTNLCRLMLHPAMHSICSSANPSQQAPPGDPWPTQTPALQVELSVYGIRRQPRGLHDQTVPRSAAAMLPGGGELVIAGDNAVLQFYDAVKDRHLDKLQVTPATVTWTQADTDWY